jgi:putative ABC transport system permease protein
VIWLKRLAHRKRLEHQMQSELRDHLERQLADNMRSGMSESEARRNAVLRFGGYQQTCESCRDVRGTQWVESSLQDLRFSTRTLRKNPGFALAAILTLALGIGANTAIFSVINGVLLRPLPYRDPSRLVAVQEQFVKTGEDFAFSYPDFLDCQRASQSFERIAAWRSIELNVTSPGEPQFARARQVSAGFLSVLGISPLLGRDFRPEDDRPGTQPVALINYALWQERFGGKAGAIGAKLIAAGKPYTVIGILPASFRFHGDAEVLTPIGQNDTLATQKRDMYSGIEAIARLKPGVTLDHANSELKAIGQRLAREYPETNSKATFGAVSLKQDVVGDIGSTLLLLAGAVALVLLISCANVANLFLARSLSRSHEFAIRSTLGAAKGRLVRQLLSEGLLLSVSGGIIGFGTAAILTIWAIRRLPDWLPRTEDVGLDWRVLVFTIGASLLTGVVFGLIPAFRRNIDLEGALRQGVRGTSRNVRRLQTGFVIAELALALILLTGAGLMLRSILQLWNVNPGFDPAHVLVMNVSLSPKVLNSPTATRRAWNQILERVQSTPGVEAAALDSLLPLSGGSQSVAYWTTPETAAPPNAPYAAAFTPTAGYLRTMKIPLLKGRFFTDQDRLGSQKVIVIDEIMAKRIFPHQDAVGRDLSVQFLGQCRIVGIVGAVKHQSLDENAGGSPQPAVYIPILQFPDEFMSMTQSGMTLLVRTSMNPTSVIQAVKKSVLGPTRDQPVRDVMTMEQVIGASLGKRRGMLILLGIFAGIALVLASIGIYGVISYSMRQRVQEVGIRMALGARPAQVMRLVLRQATSMILAGVVIGTIASLCLARLLTALLYGVTPADPVTFIAVVGTLCVVSLLAIYLPARRAARTDPLVALRHE